MRLLPAGYRFSQGSLATSQRCQRRFYLRYLRRLSWPAAADAAGLAKEQGSVRGRFFHHLVHQHALGLRVDEQVAANGDPVLAEWWANYLKNPPQGLPAGKAFPELELWVPLGSWRLTARFDRVIAGEDGRLCIVDWKTGGGEPAAYLDTWQTLVYCFVLCEAGSLITGGASPTPAQVSLCYWPAAFPDQVQWYQYDQASHARAREKLLGAVEGLAGLASREAFAQTTEIQHCLSCEYRSYCARGAGVGAGWEDEEEEEEDWGLAPGLEP